MGGINSMMEKLGEKGKQKSLKLLLKCLTQQVIKKLLNYYTNFHWRNKEKKTSLRK